jgi:predicted SnoaL-like aldol condensation-catalyzing enzyme
MAVLYGLASGDAQLATQYLSPDCFIQHDPLVADGIAGVSEQISRSPSKEDRLEAARVFVDHAFVVVHGRTDNGEGEVFFAVFRFDDDLIVEHWHFSVPAAPPNESGHSQTDGATHPDDRQDTDRNKVLVRDYYESVHIAGKHDRIRCYMSDGRQIRHEPGVRDGVEAFEKDLATLTLSRTIEEIVLLLGQGDFVFIAAKGTHNGEPCAYIDLYRVEADKLVEHWGFPEAVPPREKWKNANGLI